MRKLPKLSGTRTESGNLANNLMSLGVFTHVKTKEILWMTVIMLLCTRRSIVNNASIISCLDPWLYFYI